MLNTESYEKKKKALCLLKLLVQGEREIANGNALTQEEFFSALDRDFDPQYT